MTKFKHIAIVELDDTEEAILPTANDLFDLHDALRIVVDLLKEEAQRNPTQGRWEAAVCMEHSLYDIHGAAGWLAKHEGLLK